MSEFRYSSEPASFYTFVVNNERVGIGGGYSALHGGFWNLVWLTCSQCDEYEKTEDEQQGLPVWTEEYAAPYLATARHELGGTRIEDLAAVLKAETFVHFLTEHEDFKYLPLYQEIGPAWMISLLDRYKKSADIRISDHSLHNRVLPPQRVGPDLTPQTLTRGKVIHMKDWLARIPGA